MLPHDSLDRLPLTLADKLAEVRYTPMVSVTVFVDRRSFTRPVHGVGVLMPAREQTKSLGILFNSSSFADRVADESRFASFTVMMGGTAQPHWLTASDDEIRQAIKLELSTSLGNSRAAGGGNPSLAGCVAAVFSQSP